MVLPTRLWPALPQSLASWRGIRSSGDSLYRPIADRGRRKGQAGCEMTHAIAAAAGALLSAPGALGEIEMPNRPRPLVAGNWKMNGLQRSAQGAGRGRAGLHARACKAKVDLLVCPPATLIAHWPRKRRRLAASPSAGRIATPRQSGAYHRRHLGRDAGRCRRDLRHRRPFRAPRSTTARRTPTSAPRPRPPTAPGSPPSSASARREASARPGKTLDVVARQLARLGARRLRRPANLVVAYEPVWAIGTGLTPTAADVAEVHALIRDELAPARRRGRAGQVRILYGGSVKPVNAAELLAVDERRRRAGRRRQPRGGGFPGDRGGVYLA